MPRARQDLDQPPADPEGTSLSYEETLIAELPAKIGHDHQPSKRKFLAYAGVVGTLGVVGALKVLDVGADLITWDNWIRSRRGPAVAPVNNHRVDASRASVTWRTTQPSVSLTRADLPIAGGAVRV